MLIENLAEIVPVAALVMGIIASIYAYRQAERQKSPATPGMVAIGGALASEGATKIHAEEIQKLAQSLDRLAKAQHETANAIRESTDRSRDFLDEFERIRRSLQEIAGLMKR